MPGHSFAQFVGVAVLLLVLVSLFLIAIHAIPAGAVGLVILLVLIGGCAFAEVLRG